MKRRMTFAGDRARKPSHALVRGALLAALVPTLIGMDAASSGAVTVPSVTVPTITVPKITVPSVTTPVVTVRTPSTSTPSASTPSLSRGSSGGGGGSGSTSGVGVAGAGAVVTGSSGSGYGSTSTYVPATGASADTGSGAGGSSGSAQAKQSQSQREASERRADARERYLKQLVSRDQGCLGELSPQGERTLILRTGEGGGRAYSPAQVAHMLGVSQAREQRIEQSAVNSLRGYGRSGACSSATQSGITQSVAVTLAGVVPFGIASGGPSSSAFVASTNGSGKGSGSNSGSGSAQKGSGSGGTSSPSIDYATLRPPTHGGGGFPLLVLVLLGVGALVALAFGPEYVNHRRLRMAAESTFAAPMLLRKPARSRAALRERSRSAAALAPAPDEHEEPAAVPYDAEATHYEEGEAEQLPPAGGSGQAAGVEGSGQAAGAGALPEVRASQPSNGRPARPRQLLMMAASLGGALFARSRRQRSGSRRKSHR